MAHFVARCPHKRRLENCAKSTITWCNVFGICACRQGGAGVPSDEHIAVVKSWVDVSILDKVVYGHDRCMHSKQKQSSF